MKNVIIIGFLISISFYGLSQKKELPIIHKEIIAGKNYLTKQDIIGNQYSFPCLIYDSYFDTSSKKITLLLRYLKENGKKFTNRGFIAVFDLQNNNTCWFYEAQSFDIMQSKDMLIRTIDNSSFRLNYSNGSRVWESNYRIFYIDSLFHVGLGYYGPSESPSVKLNGIDLSDGSIKWTRKIPHEYGWNDIQYLNDNSIIVVSSGLHTINLKTGEGWDYNATTGHENYNAAIVTAATVIVIGVLTGFAPLFTGAYPKIVTGIASNAITDNSRIYFASKDSVVCLDYNGKLIWGRSVSKKLVSNSSIFIKDSLLYLINRGYAYFEGREIYYGTVFLSAYNLDNGNQKFLTTIEEKNQVKDYRVEDESIVLILDNKIAKYMLTNGALLMEQPVNEIAYGKIQYFADENTYIKSGDSAFISLSITDTAAYYISTLTNDLVSLSRNFQIIHQIDSSTVFRNYLNWKNYRFLANGNETDIIDENNRRIAVINISDKAVIIGTTIYDIQKENLISIDLKDIMGL